MVSHIPIPMTTLLCAKCSVPFQIPTDMEVRRRKDGKKFWCPRGHANSWDPERDKAADAKRLRELHEQEQREAREAEGREAGPSATQQTVDRLMPQALVAQAAHNARQRIDRGRLPCPVCGKSYGNRSWVLRHLRRDHNLSRGEARANLEAGAPAESERADRILWTPDHRLLCPCCPRTMVYIDTMKKHLAKAHGRTPEQINAMVTDWCKAKAAEGAEGGGHAV